MYEALEGFDVYWLQQRSVRRQAVLLARLRHLSSASQQPFFPKSAPLAKAGKLILSGFTVLSDDYYFQSCAVAV